MESALQIVCVERHIERPDGPALRPDGLRWWSGLSACAQNQLGFRVSRGIC